MNRGPKARLNVALDPAATVAGLKVEILRLLELELLSFSVELVSWQSTIEEEILKKQKMSPTIKFIVPEDKK